MALAEYNDVYWFPDGSLARNTPARIFPEFSNNFAQLYADQAGTQPLPNPLNTDDAGRLRFWAEAGVYWISIDQESIRVGVGTGVEGITPQQVDAKIAEHNADTTDVHGIADTSQLATGQELAAHAADTTEVHGIADTAALETQIGAQAKADAAQTTAIDMASGLVIEHNADTTGVHGIADTAALETQAGAQAKADTAQASAQAAASADATAKVSTARAELEEQITSGDQATAQNAAGALAAHAAQTQNVHGIPDTATIPTDAQFQQVRADLTAHESDTTGVHGIADTAALATDADVSAVQQQVTDHVADTTGVHGIADTSQLLTSADMEQYATDADLAAHAAQTLNVHGIPDTGDLVTGADLAGMASDAEVAAVQGNLDAHAADTTAVHGIADTSQLLTQADVSGLVDQAQFDAHTAATTNVHGIPDTSALLTQQDLSAYATDAELAAHTGATTGVHGIADTSVLETQAGAQAKADGARDAAIAEAAARYLDRTTGGTVTGDLTVTGALNAAGVTDWLNARTFGATGDDVTDDTEALEAALDACPPGGVLYLPNGRYRTSRTLWVPPGVTVMMPHSNLMAVPGITDVACSIKPLPDFTGPCVVGFLNREDGGYSTIPAEHRLINVMIDGSGYNATGLDGIQAKGNVQNVVMHGVTIRYMSGNGIYTDIGDDGVFPYSWRLYRVMVDNNGAHGFSFAVMTDITLFDCQSIGNAANGFQLRNLANSQMMGCRAEWNGNHGYNFTGDWGQGAGAGALVATACSTDRNGFDGVHFECTGTPPLVFSGLYLRRDGRNNGAGGGGFSAITAYGATTPIVISGLVVYPGTDDNGTGTPSPETGVKLLNGTQAFLIDEAYIHVATEPIFDDGTNGRVQFGPGVQTVTGPTGAPVAQPAPPWDSPGRQRTEAPTGDAIVRSIRVDGDTRERFEQTGAGELKWGPGDADPDVILGRAAAGVLALTGTLAQVVSAAETLGYGVRVAGDTGDRIRVNGDGSIGWGSGAGGTDVHLRRAAVNLLQLDDNLAVVGTSTYTGTATFNGALNATGMSTFHGWFQIMRAATSDTGYASQITGEPYDSFRIGARGQMEWGPGGAIRDSFLVREGAGVMAWNDTIQRIYRASAGGNALATRVVGDTASRFFINADGALWWGTGAATVDTGLWRTAAGQLTTGAAFQTVRGAAANPVRDVRVSGDAQPRFYQTASGQMYWGAGGTYNLDTTLYRDQTNSLVTDGNFTINGLGYANNFQVNGRLTVGGVGQRLFARRSANLTRTNTTSRTNDPDLQVVLAPNSVYTVEMLLIWGGSAAGDLGMHFNVPTGATGWWTSVQPSQGVATDPAEVRTAANTITQYRTYGWFDNGSPQGAMVRGIVTTGATGGTFALAWAQVAASTTGTIVYANSYLALERVE